MEKLFPMQHSQTGVGNICLENRLSALLTADRLQPVVTSPWTELLTFIQSLKFHILSNRHPGLLIGHELQMRQ